MFSSGVDTLTPDSSDPLATFMNPSKLTLWRALSELGIREGIVAIAGGRSVFDHFASDYDAFMLSEVNGEVILNGTPCFSSGHPRTVLASHGLTPRSFLTLDADARLTQAHWVRFHGP